MVDQVKAKAEGATVGHTCDAKLPIPWQVPNRVVVLLGKDHLNKFWRDVGLCLVGSALDYGLPPQALGTKYTNPLQVIRVLGIIVCGAYASIIP